VALALSCRCKEKLVVLGEYPLVGLGQAREIHFAARKTLTAGIDPMAERKAETEAKQREAELRTEACDHGRALRLNKLKLMVAKNLFLEENHPNIAAVKANGSAKIEYFYLIISGSHRSYARLACAYLLTSVRE
jgi:hypothetical protein